MPWCLNLRRQKSEIVRNLLEIRPDSLPEILIFKLAGELK